MKNKFKLPNVPVESEMSQQKVMVVSFFGKSPLWAKSCKAGDVDAYCGRQIFEPSLLEDPVVGPDTFFDIEGYYDAKKRVIFLHLRGVFDTHTLVKAFDEFSKDLDEKGYLCVWAGLNHQYARALLLLFLVSHVLVLCHPTHGFDTSYVHLFRALDAARLKLAPALTEQLRAVGGLPKDWVAAGRPCPPRVLFLCQTCPAPFARPCARPHTPRPSVKKLEHALEDMIYNLLRKSRVVSNASANSLFAIPANQEFVYVATESRPSRDRLSHMINSLVDFCKHPPTEGSRFETPSVQEEPDPADHSFASFLQQHIDQGFLKGFDDNVGRHMVPSHFEVVSASLWFRLAAHLHGWLVEGPDGPACTALRDKLGTDMRFSEARCGKVLPVALAAYQEGLPPHYMRSYHERKLGHALAVFALHARGPVFEQCAAQLERQCDALWRAGRQMCEVLSLTGNPCTKPLHRGGGEGAGGGELLLQAGGDGPDRDLTQLPVTEHSSGARYVSACNCGRKQGAREDPYSARSANHDYYTLLAEECGCRGLESLSFPVFQPSTQDFRAAQLFPGAPRSGARDVPRQEGRELTVATPQGNTSGCSLVGFVSGQSGPSDGAADEAPHTSQDGQEIVIHVSDSEESVKDKTLVRQPSTTEYLPGMLHADSPAGLLPQFPSWSLVCLGPSSLYSHNLGLQDQQQAGMLGGSAYLLPWDVTVRLRHHRQRVAGRGRPVPPQARTRPARRAARAQDQGRQQRFV
ncbi:nonsense-mediated mRNA decay factor SMG8 isoform X2 [Bacillus rossius redtenbacheri]|uniref:nonsense-mediated mRNA decay factor SMG8 isoform X2 n=1 Tax=Bacillus rossius redtenbacheri TaxID=93214 RepID=UPI002FDE1443